MLSFRPQKQFELPPMDARLWTDDGNYRSNPAYVKAPAHLKEHADNFHRDGYTVIDESVSLAAIDGVYKTYDAWKHENADAYEANRKANGHPPRLLDYHVEDDAVCKLFYENKSLEVQDFLFGYETSIYTSIFFEVGTQQPIHRDVPVFRTSPKDYYFGMWVALEDATEENGALMVCKGGHKLVVDQYKLAAEYYDDPFDIQEQDATLWKAYQGKVLEDCLAADMPPEQAVIERGQTLIWHPLLPHGGGPIKTEGATRMSIVFHTVPYGVAVYRSDVFFNPHAEQVTNRSRFTYRQTSNKRKFAVLGGMKLRGF